MVIGIHDIALGETYEGTSNQGERQTRRVVRIDGQTAEHASHSADRVAYQSGNRRGQCSALDFVRWADRRVESKTVTPHPVERAGRWS